MNTRVGFSINTAYSAIDMLYKVYTKMEGQDLDTSNNACFSPTKAYWVCAVYGIMIMWWKGSNT